MNICSSPKWCAGTTSGPDGIFMTPTRGFVNGKLHKGEAYGRKVASHAEADAISLERGYTMRWFSRPSFFIHLRLPKRVRRYLSGKPWPVRKAAILALAEINNHAGQGQYLRHVLDNGARRQEWVDYLDGKNPERKFKQRRTP